MKIKNKVILLIIILIGFNFILKGNFKKVIINNSYKHDIMQEENKNESDLILVNKTHSLDESYKPEDLVIPKIPFLNNTTEEERHMKKEAAKAIEKLFKKAHQEGINIIGSSAYRSYEEQEKVYKHNIDVRGEKEAKKYAAIPGNSEHQTGLAIDVTNEDRWFDKSTKEAKWIANNAYKFGFILRYPEGKEDITGYNYEPWHIRYVGKDVAKAIHNEGITLEEYIKNNS